ncbi:MAG: DUF998 domain-containing protein [Herbiconiux sp.]|nr:DUF998 domain-containing protein [Herbiconiux sp.]
MTAADHAPRRSPIRLRALRSTGLVLAALLAATGLVLIWVARVVADKFVYVSELGAAGEPNAEQFRWGMTMVAVAAAVVAACAPRLSPRVRWLAVLPPAGVLAGAALAFGIASQVTCTTGCPLPVGDAFTWQDLVHTVCAVIGFAGAAFVMLQLAVDARHRRLARFSLFSAVAVAVIAGVGGLLSLLRFGTHVGGVLELVATTIALLWLVGVALFLAVDLARAGERGQSQPSQAAVPRRVAAT